MSSLFNQKFNISRKDRNLKSGHNSKVIWITGLSGSGKSTVANGLEELLFKKNIRTYTLDGDNIRRGINKELTFTEEDRTENLRRIGEIVKLFIDAGVVVIAAFISPMKKDRQMLREIIGEEDFFEVFINTPIEICEQRDAKGLYKKARSGEILNFTGISAPYEAPENPDVTINTEKQSAKEAAELIWSKLEKSILH
ncbi:MAG: adenylyl-sulfate kinase [Weeksellaceae bacterium]